MEIRLSYSECILTAQQGCMRYLHHRFKGTPQNDGLKDPMWDLDIEPTMAEYAVCKALEVPWTGMYGVGATDAFIYQVRSTKHKDGHLRIRKEDDPEDIFILVINDCPSFIIKGWCYGKDAMKVEYWRDLVPGRFAYWMPQERLHNIEELRIH